MIVDQAFHRPDRAIVFDIETRPHPDANANLGFEQKLHLAETVPDCDLEKLVEADKIKLGNAKKPEAIRKACVGHYKRATQRLALKLYGAEIHALAMTDLYEEGSDVTAWVVDDHHSEEDCLRAFLDGIWGTPAVLCGFNIRGFDLPMVVVRCIALGIILPSWFPRVNFKYEKRYVFDAEDILTEGPLDYWLRMFDLPLKSGRGSDAPSLGPDAIRQYVADDVACEWSLIRKLAPNVPALSGTIFTPIQEI